MVSPTRCKGPHRLQRYDFVEGFEPSISHGSVGALPLELNKAMYVCAWRAFGVPRPFRPKRSHFLLVIKDLSRLWAVRSF